MNLKMGDLQSYFIGFSWIWSIYLIRGINYRKHLGQLRVRNPSLVAKFEVTCRLCVGQMKDKVVIKTRTAIGKEIVSPPKSMLKNKTNDWTPPPYPPKPKVVGCSSFNSPSPRLVSLDMCVYMGMCLACYCGGCNEYNADPDGHCCTYCVRDVHCDCDEHCVKNERCCVHCPDGKVNKDKGKGSFILTKREGESETFSSLTLTILPKKLSESEALFVFDFVGCKCALRRALSHRRKQKSKGVRDFAWKWVWNFITNLKRNNTETGIGCKFSWTNQV